MPNWCSNRLTVSGEPSNVEKVINLFQQMQEKEMQTNSGQIPDFVQETDNTRFFFDIEIQDDTSVIFETRWSPNPEECTEIAKKFDVNFTLEYDEMGNMLYGKYIYTAGNEEAEEIFLDEEDFGKYQYNEDDDDYTFEGERYDSDYEILDILMERKG